MNIISKQYCVNFVSNLKTAAANNKKYISANNSLANKKDSNFKTKQICELAKSCIGFLYDRANPSGISLQERVRLVNETGEALEQFQQRVETSIKKRWWYPLFSLFSCCINQEIYPALLDLRDLTKSIASDLQAEINEQNQRAKEAKFREERELKSREQEKQWEEARLKWEKERKEAEEETKEISGVYSEFYKRQLVAEHLISFDPTKELKENYEKLQICLDSPKPVICFNDSTQPKPVLGILGKGGSKKAIELANGQALLLPNMDNKHPGLFASNWERVVTEEVYMSKLLSSLGLLSPNSQRVDIHFAGLGNNQTIPAYTSETFEKMAQKGIFVIDTKNAHSSMWKEGKHLFKNPEDRLDIKKWKPVLDALLTDVATICANHLPGGQDAANLAIVRKDAQSDVSDYEIRYFGFDFTSNDSPLSLRCKHGEKTYHYEEARKLYNSFMENEKKYLRDEAKERFSMFLSIILDSEFDYDRLMREKLKKQLVNEYIEELYKRLDQTKQSSPL